MDARELHREMAAAVLRGHAVGDFVMVDGHGVCEIVGWYAGDPFRGDVVEVRPAGGTVTVPIYGPVLAGMVAA
jgi:hypothetical protein